MFCNSLEKRLLRAFMPPLCRLVPLCRTNASPQACRPVKTNLPVIVAITGRSLMLCVKKRIICYLFRLAPIAETILSFSSFFSFSERGFMPVYLTAVRPAVFSVMFISAISFILFYDGRCLVLYSYTASVFAAAMRNFERLLCIRLRTD